jgi:hypothetical protein
LASIAVGGAALYSGLGNVLRVKIINVHTYYVWNVVSQQLKTARRCVTLRLRRTNGMRKKLVLK